jgi:hypothetical protein
MHVPETREIGATVIPEREAWPDVLPGKVSLVGIPAAKLFAGMKEEDILKLYLDFYHFNKNGQEYFARVITPTLIQLAASKHEH